MGHVPEKRPTDTKARILWKIDIIDQRLQERATGANVHLVANVRMALQSVWDDVKKADLLDALQKQALSDFPSLLSDFARFVERFSSVLTDGKVEPVEARELKEIWIHVVALGGLLVQTIESASCEGSDPQPGM